MRRALENREKRRKTQDPQDEAESSVAETRSKHGRTSQANSGKAGEGTGLQAGSGDLDPYSCAQFPSPLPKQGSPQLGMEPPYLSR